MSLLLPSWRCLLRKYDRNHKIISFSSFVPNSIVQGWIGLLTVQFTESTISIKDVAGNSRNIVPSGGNFRTSALINSADYGIVCGTGTDAVSINDYKLKSLIQPGTGTGQLQYSSVDYPSKYLVDTATALTDIRRFFTNASGDTIKVREIGIICYGYNTYRILIERTLINETLDDEESLEVTYRLSKTI